MHCHSGTNNRAPRWYNFFSSPAHLCAVTHITEIPLHVTQNTNTLTHEANSLSVVPLEQTYIEHLNIDRFLPECVIRIYLYHAVYEAK